MDNCTNAGDDHLGICSGGPDGLQDYVNGQLQTHELYRTNYGLDTHELQWTMKLDFLVAPNHTASVAWYGAPSDLGLWFMGGIPYELHNLNGSQDATARWVSKLFDHRWQLQAALTYHRER